MPTHTFKYCSAPKHRWSVLFTSHDGDLQRILFSHHNSMNRMQFPWQKVWLILSHGEPIQRRRPAFGFEVRQPQITSTNTKVSCEKICWLFWSRAQDPCQAMEGPFRHNTKQGTKRKRTKDVHDVPLFSFLLPPECASTCKRFRHV